ncbi:ABC transporter permease subunit, partial [Albidovulum sp.]|uniref:ABC transporter permease subunit n=1 Tax=Albidovulum sp. TaxID=1872424 RepID=UPI0039B84A53
MRLDRALLLHLAVLAALLALHFAAPPYHHSNIARIMVLAIYAMGYNIAFGYTGLLSLGHALLFGAGLYSAGLLVYHGGAGAAVALAAGVLAGGGMALAVGLLALRTAGGAFMIGTLMVAPAGSLPVLSF